MTVKQHTDSPRDQSRRGQVKSFRASTMDEANVLIRRELGTDAIIMSSKQLVKKSRFPWSRSAGDVVVTARSAAAPTMHSEQRQQLNRDRRNVRVNRAPLSAVRQENRESAAVVNATPDNCPPTITPAVESKSQFPEVFTAYEKRLAAADVESSITADLLTCLKTQADQAQLNNPGAMDSLLTAIVESEISTANPMRVTPGNRRVVAVVGPAGVGKTTTLSKLAANFAINESARMAVITFDTYRIAAVEQLRTYAGIIDIPVHVVTDPLEMRRVTDETQDVDLVLIDTGGHSPNDELRMQQLKQLLVEAEADDILLCLSATSGRSSLALYGERFAAIGANSLVVTKTDEAVGPGSILTVLKEAGLPVSYVSVGQDVPADLEPANATRLARLITGQESN